MPDQTAADIESPFALPHVDARVLNDGVAFRFAFENTFGASVVRHSYSYGQADGLWELAVLKDSQLVGPTRVREWKLCYSTPITDDVVGHLTIDDVNALLRRIGELHIPASGRPGHA